MTNGEHTRKRRAAKSEGRRYHDKIEVPRTVPAGRVLAHNHVRHGFLTPHGMRGFRCWTWPKDQVIIQPPCESCASASRMYWNEPRQPRP